MPDREKPGRVYATTINTATGGGYFYVSNDAGETWQLSSRSMPARLIAYTILQDPRDGNIIYLGTNYGLYRSTDRGASWAPVTAPKPKPATFRASCARLTVSFGVGFAAGAGAGVTATVSAAAARAPARPRPAFPRGAAFGLGAVTGAQEAPRSVER